MGMRAPTTNVPTLYKWNGGNILSAIQTLDADAIAFKISPNPTSRFLAVEYAADFKPTSITIYNVSGKVVWRQKEAFTPSQVIDLQSFSDGI